MNTEEMREQVKRVAKVEDMLEELSYQIAGSNQENDRLLIKAIESTHEVWKTLWSEFIDMYWAEKGESVENDIHFVTADLEAFHNILMEGTIEARERYFRSRTELGNEVPKVIFLDGFYQGLCEALINVRKMLGIADQPIEFDKKEGK